MADLFLTWEEAQGERLPHFCVSCAAPATEWADWRISKSRHGVFSDRDRFVDVTLPVCPQHRNLHWITLYRVNAREILDDGVVLEHVSPGFVEAVWDHRDQRDGQPRQSEATASPSSRRPRIADFDDYDSAALPRRRYVHRSYEAGSIARTVQKVILIAIAVMFLLPCGAMLAFALLGLILKLAFG